MTQTELTPTASQTGKWKPYPAYKDSRVEWLGEVPTHWGLSVIKRYLVSLKDGTHGTFERVLEGVLFLSAKNVANGKLEISDHESLISYLDYETINHNGYLKSGDLLLTIVGTIGRAAIFNWAEPVAFQRSVAVLRFRNNQDACYFYYLTQSKYFQAHLFSKAKESAQSGVYLSDVGLLPVLSPPLPEQRSIATFLDRETARISALIAKKERLIELLQEKRSALISHAVTKGLDPMVPRRDSGVEWLGEIPAHWEVKRLKYVIQNGLVNGLFKKKDQFGSGTKLVNVVDLYRGNFLIDFDGLDRVETEREEYETFKVLPGDIFFVRSSLKLEGVGSSASIIEVPEPAVFECHVVRIRPSSKLVISKYLINYLNSSPARQRLVALAETTTMTTISQPKLASLEITVPPLLEQRDLAIYLDYETAKIDTLISRVRNGIEKLREYRTAIISAAVTGKIDVREGR